MTTPKPKPLTESIIKNPTFLEAQDTQDTETNLSFCWKSDVLSAIELLKKELMESRALKDRDLVLLIIDRCFQIERKK